MLNRPYKKFGCIGSNTHKVKKLNNATWLNFNWFTLMKRIFSSWIIFNLVFLSVYKGHNIPFTVKQHHVCQNCMWTNKLSIFRFIFKFRKYWKRYQTRKNILIFTVIWLKIRIESNYTLTHFTLYILLKMKSSSCLWVQHRCE